MRETARKLVYAATFLLLVAHGGPGNCEDVAKNVAKIPKAVEGPGSHCSGATHVFSATGTCFQGPLSETWTCEKTTLTLPDGTTVDGTRTDGIGVYETVRGTCWISVEDYLIVCAGKEGSCESPLVNPPVPVEDAGADAADGGDGGD